MLMDAGKKMEMSMVMTGLDLEINREVELSDHSERSSQPKENKVNLVNCTISSRREKQESAFELSDKLALDLAGKDYLCLNENHSINLKFRADTDCRQAAGETDNT